MKCNMHNVQRNEEAGELKDGHEDHFSYSWSSKFYFGLMPCVNDFLFILFTI